MLVEQCAILQVHVISNIFNRACEDDAIDEQNNALTVTSTEKTEIHFHEVIYGGVLTFVL